MKKNVYIVQWECGVEGAFTSLDKAIDSIENLLPKLIEEYEGEMTRADVKKYVKDNGNIGLKEDEEANDWIYKITKTALR